VAYKCFYLYAHSGMKFHTLLTVARAVSDDVEVRFQGTHETDVWICTVWVGKDVILYETAPGSLDAVIDDVLAKLGRMSQRMIAILDTDTPENGDDPAPV